MRTDRGWRRVYTTGWLVSAGITLVTFRMWQLHLREVEQRAEEAERTRDEAAARRAVEERLRIARELHDSLTHSISVVQVQAGVAVHLARKRGEEVPPALLAIAEAGADAARELRATLGVLRSHDEDDGSGLDRLPALMGRTRSAGLPQPAVPGLASSACGNASLPSAACCRPGRAATAASGCGPSSRCGPRRDQGGAGRRPGTDPQRDPGAARRRGRHRSGRRSSGRAAGGRAGQGAPARYRPDRRSDASARRHRGDAADRGRPPARRVHVVILTNYGLNEYIFRALRAGASGFLLKDTEPAELLQALRVVMRGDALLSPAVTRSLVSEFVARPPDALALSRDGDLDQPGTRSRRPGRPRPEQRRDRGHDGPQPHHGQDPREPGHDQAGRPGFAPSWWSSPTRAGWCIHAPATTPMVVITNQDLAAPRALGWAGQAARRRADTPRSRQCTLPRGSSTGCSAAAPWTPPTRRGFRRCWTLRPPWPGRSSRPGWPRRARVRRSPRRPGPRRSTPRNWAGRPR